MVSDVDQAVFAAKSTTRLQPAIAHLHAAEKLERAGDFEAAQAAFDAAVACDSTSEMRLHRADFRLRREQFEQARADYTSVWEEAVRSENKLLTAVAFNRLSVVCRQLNEWDRAKGMQARSQAAQFATELSEQDQAVDLTNRGLDALSDGDYALAEDLLLRALLIERRLGDRSGEASDYGNLGVLASLRGDLSLAARFLARAYRLHRELADHNGSGADLSNLGELYLQLGRLSLAARCFERAHRDYELAGACVSAEQARDRAREVRHVIGALQHDPSLN